MQLCLISYEQFFEGETEIVTDLLSGLEFTFHLRKPGAMMEEIRNFLSGIPPALHRKIMLHDAYPLAKEFDVKGLHFSTRNRHLRSTFRGQVNSTSSHSLEEAAKLDRKFDYQFLSPVFPSISKPGYSGNLDMKAVKGYLQSPRNSRIIALGGITEENIPDLQKTGFDGIAVLGRIWGTHPVADTNIRDRFNKVYYRLNPTKQ